MKKYSYSIEVDFVNRGSDFLDNIIGEVKDEKNQLALTHKVNLATKKMHREILRDLAKELNATLKNVGLHFEETENVSQQRQESNLYEPHYIICKYPRSSNSHVIMINAENDRNFPDSKYTTYTGDYHLKIGTTNQGQVWSGTKDELHRCEKSVDEILMEMRDCLKSHVSRNLKTVTA